MARDITFVYETLRRKHKGLFNADVDIVYAAAMVYLRPYVKVGKFKLSDIKAQLAPLMDDTADELGCPGFFNDFAFSMIGMSEFADGLTDKIPEIVEMCEKYFMDVNYATKTTLQLIEENRIDLPKWRRKIEKALASPELAQLLRNRS